MPDEPEGAHMNATTALFLHPVLRDAYEAWCGEVSVDPGDFADGDWQATFAALTRAELLREHQSGVITANEPEQAALVLEASGVLAGRRSIEPGEAANIVAGVFENALPTPSGFEGEPDRLARVIDASVIAFVTHQKLLVRTLMEYLDHTEDLPPDAEGNPQSRTRSVWEMAKENWLIRTVVETALFRNEVNDSVFSTLANTDDHHYDYAPLPQGGYVIYRPLG